MSCNIPNQSASGVAYQTEEHQKTNEDIKQQQAEVTQPPVYIQTHTNRYTKSDQPQIIIYTMWDIPQYTKVKDRSVFGLRILRFKK